MGNARERAKKREKEMGTKQKKFWTAKEGKFCNRVLPTPESKQGDDDLYLEYMVHENIGSKKGFGRCGKDVSGKGKCYICDVVIPKLIKAGKEKRAAAMRAKQKMVVAIALVDKHGKMKGPEYWLPNGKVQRALIAKVFNNSKHDYCDAKKGRNLNWKRVGMDWDNTDYFGPDVDDESTVVPKDIIKKLVPFVEVVKNGYPLIPRYSEKELKKMYEGGDSSSASSGSSKGSSSASSSSSSSKKSSSSASGSGSASSSGSASASGSGSGSGSASASGSGSGSGSGSVSIPSSADARKKNKKKSSKKKGSSSASASSSASSSAAASGSGSASSSAS